MRALAAATLAATVACNYSHVAVPLADPAAQTCVDQCTAIYRKTPNPSWYRSCLRGCPGAISAGGECSDRDRPPVAVCSQASEVKGVVAVAIGLGVIALLVGGVFLYALDGLGDTIE